MDISLNRADGTFDDQLNPNRRREMKDRIALIDELGGYRLVVNTIDRVMKARMIFQVPNILKAAGGKVVNDKNFVAAFQTRVGKVRADKARATCNQNSQNE